MATAAPRPSGPRVVVVAQQGNAQQGNARQDDSIIGTSSGNGQSGSAHNGSSQSNNGQSGSAQTNSAQTNSAQPGTSAGPSKSTKAPAPPRRPVGTQIVALPSRIGQVSLSAGTLPLLLLGLVAVFGMLLVIAGTRRGTLTRKS